MEQNAVALPGTKGFVFPSLSTKWQFHIGANQEGRGCRDKEGAVKKQ